MKINFNPYTLIQPYTNKTGQAKVLPSFKSAKTRKMIEELQSAKNLRQIKFTFDDVVSIYNDIGYDVILKRGSHASVPLTDKMNVTIVIPHDGHKFVHLLDIKRLKYVLDGDIEKALSLH